MILPLLLAGLVHLVGNVFTLTKVIEDNLELTGRGSVGFGRSVRINNDIVVVASPLDDENSVDDVGSITIFSIRTENIVREKITRNETHNAGDKIGYSLGLSDDFLVVSSIHGDGGEAGGKEGVVYVHRYNGNDWLSNVQKIFAHDGTTNAEFGSSVGIHGNTLVVGARYDNAAGNNSGSTYVFTYNGSVWTQKQKLLPNDLASDEMIGSCVAISNRYIALGGRRVVYIFKKDDLNGLWVEQTKLNPPKFSNSNLGNNLDIYESRIIIGVDNDGDSRGKAYVYTRDAGSWVLEDTLTATYGNVGNHFGFSVSIDKQTIVVGAFNSTNGRGTKSGSVYVFEFLNKTWTETLKFLNPSQNDGVDYFGVSVDVVDGVVVVGRSDSNGTGSAHVYTSLRNFLIQCGELSAHATWRRAQFPGEIQLTLNDPLCNTFSGGNRTHVWIEFRFSECGTLAIQHDNVVIFKNTANLIVTSSTSNMIEWGTGYNFNMNCEITRWKYTVVKQMYNVTRPDDVFPPIVNEIEIPLEDFDAKITLYTNQYFVEQAFSPITVSVSEPMYIGITEQTEKLKFKFTVRQCTATPKTDMDSSFTFFYQGCPVDSNGNALQILGTDNTYFRFQMDAFRFLSLSQAVYIHCLLYICHFSSTAPGCVQTCADDDNSRKRRSNEAPLQEVVVTTPLLEFEQKDTCDVIQCPEHSTCWELFPASCRCNDGYVKNMETDLCDTGQVQVVGGQVENRFTNIENIVIDKPFIDAYLDTNTVEFQKLARDAEDQLAYYIELYADPSIVGIKVVSARQGSVILNIVVIRNANVTDEGALDTFIGAVISNRTRLVNEDEKRNSSKPLFLGISIKIVDGEIPVIGGGEATVLDTDETERRIIIAILVPAMTVLVVCFIIMVVVIQRRTQNHYLLECN